VLKVARTVADLDRSGHVRLGHLATALALRVEAYSEGTRAT
jgi:predicted ATPase with chaperone activity